MNVRSQKLEWILVSSYSPPFHFNRISFLWFHSDQSSFKIIIASRLKGSGKAAQSAADYLNSYQSICKIGIWSAKTSPSDSQDLTPSDSEGNYGPSKPARSSWGFLQGEPWIRTRKRRPKKKKLHWERFFTSFRRMALLAWWHMMFPIHQIYPLHL